MTSVRLLIMVPGLALALAGCETMTRFGGAPQPLPQVAARPAPVQEPIVAAPTSPVQSAPLPPVAGAPAPPPVASTPLPGAGAPDGTTPPMTPGVAQPTGTDVARIEEPAPQPARPAAPRTVSGNWRVTDVGRGQCTVLLTNSPLLDLYRARPSGCQAGSLARVNAWQQRGQEIVLIEPGGRTAVRLFPKGDGTYEGAATTSGVVVRMAR